MIVVALQGQPPGPPGVEVFHVSGLMSVTCGGVVGGNVIGFCCFVSTLVFVLALAYVLTLAAALAPLRAFEDVAMRVFTLVFVNV